MAAQENIFEELAPYARLTVIPGVSVGQLNFVNQADLVYTAATTFTSGVVAANTQLQFFQAALGDSATNAGYTSGTITTAASTIMPKSTAPSEIRLAETFSRSIRMKAASRRQMLLGMISGHWPSNTP